MFANPNVAARKLIELAHAFGMAKTLRIFFSADAESTRLLRDSWRAEGPQLAASSVIAAASDERRYEPCAAVARRCNSAEPRRQERRAD